MSEIDNTYRERLTWHLLSLLDLGRKDFCGLVRLAAGAYPTEVKRVLDILVAEGQVRKSENDYFVSGNSGQHHARYGILTDERSSTFHRQQSAALAQVAHHFLSDPHPADYDWRFTEPSLTELTNRLQPLVGHRANIALFGTTTLFPLLARIGAHVTLFDRSTTLLKDLRSAGFNEGLIEHDLFNPILNSICDQDVVVADPPWYPEYHRAFILRSAELLRNGGLLLLSVLPWLTRPSAVEDRTDILAFAAKAGLDLQGATPGILTYESPKFEQVALKKEGLDCDAWRSGDLYLFHKVNQPTPGLNASFHDYDPEWDEFRLAWKRIKLRRRLESQDIRFSIRPVVGDNPILRTVSRRSPFRSNIDLWTSDNVAYSVSGVKVLKSALERLEKGESPGSISKSLAHAFSLSDDEREALISVLEDLLVEGEVS